MYASIAGYRLGMEEGTPEQYQRYGEHATLVETFDLGRTDRDAFFLSVARPPDWPFLCVVQR